MTNKKYNYPSFYIYSSQDGKKATNFKQIKHERDDKIMWFKLWIDFTKEGWKNNKSSIMLDKDELLEILSVLYWIKKIATFKRRTKTLAIKDQSSNFFITYNDKWENYYCRVSKPDWINLAILCLESIKKEYGRDNLYPSNEEIKENVIAIYKSAINEKNNERKNNKKKTLNKKNDNNDIDWHISFEKEKCADCDYDLSWKNAGKVKKWCKQYKEKYNYKLLCPKCQAEY